MMGDIAEERDHNGPSVYDRVKDLIGSYHGPVNFSTNPEAYGRFWKGQFAKGGATMKTITIKVPDSLEKEIVY